MAKTGVLIVLDDFPHVNRLLIDGCATIKNRFVDLGIEFTRPRAANPRCAPNRSSILTGQPPHLTTVIDNDWAGAGGAFTWDVTLATTLNGLGWKCSFYGKLSNGSYGCDAGERADCMVVPPGWDLAAYTAFKSSGVYIGQPTYDLYIHDGGAGRNVTTQNHGSDDDDPVNYATTDYTTDLICHKADLDLRATNPATNMFVYLAPKATHNDDSGVNRPAARHNSGGPGNWQPADSYNLVDAPGGVGATPPYHPEYVYTQPPLSAPISLNLYHRTMQSLDEGILKIINAIVAVRDINDTLMFLISDNGFLLGELRFPAGKSVPYLPARRTPMYAYGPGVLGGEPRQITDLVVSYDIPVTFAHWAGASGISGSQGISLLPKLQAADPTPLRDGLLMSSLLSVGDEGGDPDPIWISWEDNAGDIYTVYPYGDLVSDVDRAPFVEWYKPADTGEQDNRQGIAADSAREAALAAKWETAQALAGNLKYRQAFQGLIGSVENNGSSTTAVISVGVHCPVGHHFVIAAFCNKGSATRCRVKTSAEPTWVPMDRGWTDAASSIFLLSNRIGSDMPAASGHTITVEWTDDAEIPNPLPVTERRVYAYLVRNMKQTGWFNNATAIAQGSDAYPKTQAYTTTQPGEFLIHLTSHVNSTGSMSEGAGWDRENLYTQTLRHCAVQQHVVFGPDTFTGTGELQTAGGWRTVLGSYFQEPAPEEGGGGGGGGSSPSILLGMG